MAPQLIYKNIAFRNEAVWGTSGAGTNRVLQIVSSDLMADPGKALVDSTTSSVKGRDRIVRGRNEVGGDIKSFLSPKVFHNFFEMAFGMHGTSAAVGNSAILTTYNQDSGGSYISYTVVKDRNNSQEAFYGVRGTKLSLQASDGLVETTLSTIAQTRGIGPSLADTTGETVKPFVFADVTVTIGGPAYANPYTAKVSDWSIEYDTDMERSYLSGSRDASRTDAKVPKVEGEFKIFHEGNSWVSAVYGSSELYLRFEFTTDSSEGLIAGVTPYYGRVNIPRVELISTERNYEQGNLSVEVVKFTGMFDQGTSALIQAQLTHGFDIET